MSFVHLHLLSSVLLIQITPYVHAVADLSGLRYCFSNKIKISNSDLLLCCAKRCRQSVWCVVAGMPFIYHVGCKSSVSDLHETLYHSLDCD